MSMEVKVNCFRKIIFKVFMPVADLWGAVIGSLP